ncbi:MAG TPA: head-tail connector protein [Lachnospiraceae bacterium]|jgi:hypothetical protein|nr:head-tail connector protein [Lachnospiraceae bacterium]
MHVTLEDAKEYLRVSSADEDSLIEELIKTSEAFVKDVARCTDEEWDSGAEAFCSRTRVAVLYTIAYFYEHREEADHHELTLTLRSLLFGTRKEGF